MFILFSIYIQNISKMGQQHGLMGKSALTLVQFLEPTGWQERTDCYTLSAELHMNVMACVKLPPHKEI